MRTMILRALVTAGVIGLVIGSSAATVAAAPPRNGGIAYAWSTVVEGEDQFARYAAGLNVVGARGGRARTLAGCDETVAAGQFPPPTPCTLASFGSPAFSSDGKRIAFDSGPSIAVVNADASGDMHVLPAHSEDDGDPAFSPAGTRLAFSAGTDTTRSDDIVRSVWVSDIDGAEGHQVSPRGSSPTWSSRNVIAFVRAGEIWVVRPNGQGLRQVTGGGGFAPAWSPDGTKIAFSRHGSIFVLDVVAHRLRRAVRGAGAVGLAWSPDGRRFAVHVYRRGIRTMDLHGRDVRQIVPEELGELYSWGHRDIDWQPLR